MTIAQSKPLNQPMTLAAYLDYDDGTDSRYELVDGILVEMPTESPLNNTIALLLISTFLSLGIPYYRLATHHQIQVHSDQVTAREPDLILHTEASAAAILKDGKLLRLDQPAPQLVVEVVSSSDTDKVSRDRDYIEKRREYAQRGIPEYWIIDPIAAAVWVLTRVGDAYQDHKFVGADRLVSPSLAALALTAEQILTAGL
ncbi:MAG: Uma2 family endonuclease [Leptolyngbya sp. RL_3_1]|nr:Uma2 family endonuclease [Leptolyngbya sp. RL_3_1]